MISPASAAEYYLEQAQSVLLQVDEDGVSSAILVSNILNQYPDRLSQSECLQRVKQHCSCFLKDLIRALMAITGLLIVVR
ncbi:hypothetical protein [Bifidobacterium crudilactis]|jgi:hypothetical protein|uniref:hypothetical protein n=1 Tax=Bifidobacterium crudilactis TaxID=327277 RepID=UPI002F34FB4F